VAGNPQRSQAEWADDANAARAQAPKMFRWGLPSFFGAGFILLGGKLPGKM